MFCGEKAGNFVQKYRLFSSNNILPKRLIRREEKSKEDEQTSAELSSAHRRSQAKCQLIQTSYIKLIKLLLLAHAI